MDAWVEAWLAGAPMETRQTCEGLLRTVEGLRAEQTIYPVQKDIFRSLQLVAPNQVRVVILGQDPYHEPGQAMGLSFSVPAGCKLPPSLRNIYKELSADLGCPMPESGDLTSWAQQGVLLLNTTLTVREHAANSHSKLGWQTVTSYVLGRCMSVPQPVVFMGWGRPALKLLQAARTSAGEPVNKPIIASTHPSPLSANRSAGELPAFMESRPFSQANQALLSLGAQPVNWASVAE